MKLKSREISGFRGIRKDISIDLDSSKSILIYGDNGSGKSSIADAFEWFYYDKIEHLSSEEIGTKGVSALRNIFLSDNEDVYVELNYSDSKCDSRKRLFYKKSKFSSEYSNASQNFNDYRNTSLKDKRCFKKAVNDLKKELKLKNFDYHINAKQAHIIEQIGQNITNDEQYLGAIRELVIPLNLPIEVKDNSSIDTILELLKKPEDKEAVTLQLSYEKVIENLSSFKVSFNSLCTSYKAFYEKCQQIAKDQEKFKKISLEPLLSQGFSILEKRLYEDDKCPLCLQDKGREELIDELRKRIEELSIFKKEKDAAEEEKNITQRLIQGGLTEIENVLKEKSLLLEGNSALRREIEQVKGTISTALEKIRKASLSEVELINKPEDFISLDITALQNSISTLTSKKEKIITGKKDDITFTVYSKIISVRQSYNEIKSYQKALKILTQQQQSMELIYNEFVKRQRVGLCSFLKSISLDINDLYLFMNDSENVSEIELVPLDEDDEFVGITLQFKFHGKPESPPHKYLSESP